MKKYFLLPIFLLHLYAGMPLRSDAQVYPARLSLTSLFSPNADLQNGIIGTVTPGGRITIGVYERKFNTCIYEVFITTSTSAFTGQPNLYSRSQLGPGATYYPLQWNSNDMITSVFCMDRKYYDAISPRQYAFLSQPMDVEIRITATNNSKLALAKIPGIGTTTQYGKNILFDPGHYCSDLTRAADFPCVVWTRMKSPDTSRGSNLIIAAHRGIWGDKLGSGNPENSTASILSTVPITPVLESDVMITKDDQLIVSHDYNLKRLSNYTGSDRDYLFNMDFSQVAGLKLRRRNESISDYKYLRFDNLIQDLLDHHLVLTIDIKDIRSRYDKQGNCVDNCAYDDRHGTDEQKAHARQMIMNSWRRIFAQCVAIARSKNALAYIAFKLPHDLDSLRGVVPDEDLAKVLYMPVIQPGNDIGKVLSFVDSWNRKGGSKVVAFETNFKVIDNVYLRPFFRNHIYYDNLLHYVYQQSGLRPGCYPEEPMGPKGIVNRWADWLIKDLRTDIRGDHYLLMTVPYGKLMVLTTDRPFIWMQIEAMYDK